MGNLKAPASSFCTKPGCRIEARAATVQAQFTGFEVPNTRGLGMQSTLTTASSIVCSKVNPALCLTLTRNDPTTFVNFTTGYSTGCETEIGPRCVGQWATIFGAWVNSVDAAYNSTPPVQLVDCRVSFGNVTIAQSGAASPSIDHDSFDISSQTETEIGAAANAWRRIYTTESTQSPYTFAALRGGANSNSLYQDNILALLLFNYADASGANATAVAATIEANFDMGTLFAFARAPQAASVTIITDDTVNMWHYDARILAVLAVPVLAMIAALWSRWRVCDAQDVVTYKPVDIARSGPVDYLYANFGDDQETVHAADEEADEQTFVWGIKSSEALGGQGTVKLVSASAF